MISVVTLDGTVILKVPSFFVDVPTRVPLPCTEAPKTGVPSFESVTLPVTVLSWALAVACRTKKEKVKKNADSSFFADISNRFLKL